MITQQLHTDQLWSAVSPTTAATAAAKPGLIVEVYFIGGQRIVLA